MAECPDCREVRRDAAERLAALKELLMLRIDGVEKLTDERTRTTADALSIQTQETARRLDALNGEAERLRTMQATYLPREVFETINRDVHRELVELKAFRDTSAGRQSVVTIAISTVFAVLGLLLNFFLYRVVRP